MPRKTSWSYRKRWSRKHRLEVAAASSPEGVRKIAQEYAYRKRRGVTHNSYATLTEAEWKIIVAAWGNRCAYCGKDGPLALDHVIPISTGGEHARKNVVPACKSCNSSKKDLPLDAFVAIDAIASFLNRLDEVTASFETE